MLHLYIKVIHLMGRFGFNGKDGTFDSTVYKRQDIFIRVKTFGWYSR